jgi:hypothetical protein
MEFLKEKVINIKIKGIARVAILIVPLLWHDYLGVGLALLELAVWSRWE